MRKQTVKQRKALGTGSRKTRSRSPAAKTDHFKRVKQTKAMEAANALELAFFWGEAREGFEHWEAIYRRLCEIGGVAPFTAPLAPAPQGREMIANDIGIPLYAFQQHRKMRQAEFDAAHPSLWQRLKAWLA
jgi:hypothetical protein